MKRVQSEYINSRILLVDDDMSNNLLVQSILSNHGFKEVRSITDSRMIQYVYKEFSPELILLDVEMPHMNGFETFQKLQEISGKDILPVIMVTARKDIECKNRAFNIGVQYFIEKPVSKVELLTRVENILRIYKLYKQPTRGHGIIEKESIATIENNIVDRLSLSIDFKSHETSEHLDRVSSSVYILSKGMGFDNETASNYSKASKLHDIGKIGIPDSILLKKGALDDEEWKLMKSHTLIGERILSAYNTKLLNIASTIAVTHHENWDGSGYPYGLVGDQIDIAGRLTAIADVFDAMLSERSYKSPWDIDSVISYIHAQNGIKFDPKVVEVFSKELSKIMGLYTRYKYS